MTAAPIGLQESDVREGHRLEQRSAKAESLLPRDRPTRGAPSGSCRLGFEGSLLLPRQSATLRATRAIGTAIRRPRKGTVTLSTTLQAAQESRPGASLGLRTTCSNREFHHAQASERDKVGPHSTIPARSNGVATCSKRLPIEPLQIQRNALPRHSGKAMLEDPANDRPSALRNRNFRRYQTGQGLSHTGVWLQQVAELWFVLEITGSATALGVVTALRFGPILMFGAYGGLLGDRIDRRSLMIRIAFLKTAGAIGLALIARQDAASLAAVYALVLLQGLLATIDNPVRRSFVRDLVDDRTLANAISLNSVFATTSRTVGPAIGGFLIARSGVAWCFGVAAVSYLAVVVSLLIIDPAHLRPAALTKRGPGQIRAGLAYAFNDRRIGSTLALATLVSIFAWNWNVLLPVYAQEELGGGPELYGTLVATLSAGSIAGAAFTSRILNPGRRHLLVSAAAVSVALLLVGLLPSPAVALGSLFLLGATASSFTISAQARLQLNVRDEMSGRIMALYSMAWLGSKPVGGMIGGLIADGPGVRAAFIFGSVMVALSLLALTLSAGGEGRRELEPPIR